MVLTQIVWDGGTSTNWATTQNWVGNKVPGTTDNVLIPDAGTTLNSPILGASTEIKSLQLAEGALLTIGGTSVTLSINGDAGAWDNVGATFDPGTTSTVLFKGTSPTFAGIAPFVNLTINNGTTLLLGDNSAVSISGTVTNSGTWRAVIAGKTTVEYNGGNQTVVVPNSTTNRYYHLILSGTGTKTMPATALQIVGDFTLSGTATVTAGAAMTFSGSMNINNSPLFPQEISTMRSGFPRRGDQARSGRSIFPIVTAN